MDMNMDMDYGPSAESSQSQKPFPVKLVVGLLVGAVILVVGILIILIQAMSGPREVVDKFMMELSSGNNEAAYELTSVEFQQAVEEPTFARLTEEFPILADYTNYSFQNSSVTGEEAFFSGNIENSKNESEPLTIRLVKEDGKWKIFSLSLRPEDVLEIDDDF